MRHIRLMSARMICALAAPTLGLRCGGSGSGDADGDGDSDRPLGAPDTLAPSKIGATGSS